MANPTYQIGVQTTNIQPIIIATANATNQLGVSIKNLKSAVGDLNFDPANQDLMKHISLLHDANTMYEQLKKNVINTDVKDISLPKKMNVSDIGGVNVAIPTDITKNLDKVFSVVDKNVGKTTTTIKKEVKKTTKFTADQFADSADRAVMAVDSISGAFGGGSTGLSGVVGDVINMIKNPLTLAIAGVGTLIAGIVKYSMNVYDNLHLSTEQLKAQIDQISNWTKQKQGNHKQTTSQVQQLIDEMKKMSKDGIFDTMQLIRAQTIIKRLKKQFKQLGIAVSDEHFATILDAVKKGGTSGRWAADRLQYLKDYGRSQTSKRLAQQAADQQVRMGAALFANSDFLNIVWAKTKTKGTIAPDSAHSQNIKRAKNIDDITKYRFVATEYTEDIVPTDMGPIIAKAKRDPLRVAFEKEWNRLMDAQDYEGVINLLKEEYKKAKTEKDQQTIVSIINALQQQLAKNAQADLVREKIDSQTIADLGRYVENAKQDMLKKIKDRRVKFEEKRQDKNEQLRTMNWNDTQFIADETKNLNDIIKQQTRYSDYLKKLNKSIREWQVYTDKLVKKWRKDPNSVSMQQIIRANRNLSILYNRKANTEGRIVDLQQQQLDSRYQINRRLKQAAIWTRDQYNNNIDQANQLSYLAAKDYKGYYKYKDDLLIENSGKKLNKQQRRQFYEGQQQLRTTQARYNFRQNAQKFYQDLFSTIDPKGARKAQMIDEFRKTKGEDLTKGELKAIDKLVNLQHLYENQPKLDLSRAQIMTNELTSRGGMKYGAVDPSVNRVNQMIASNTQTTAHILGQIKNSLQNGWRI